MDVKKIISDLSQQIGVAGSEHQVSAYAKKLLQQYTNDVSIDKSGSVIAKISPAKDNKPHIMFDAHIDEIGMIVTGIDKNGFLKVSNCGGVDRRILLAQEVIVHAKEQIFGVVATKPPHLESEENAKKSPVIDDIIIDVGMTKHTAEQKISLGDRVTIKSKVRQLLGTRISGKAFDDRAGMAAIIHALDKLKGEKLDCGLSVIFSVQEEVGIRGAQTAAFTVKPDIAIAVDVSFALTSDAPEHKCGKMGEGVMIGISSTLTQEISDGLVRVAEKNKIPYQLEIMGGTTSTNTDEIGVVCSGVKTGLCSIPLKYMHTPIEVIQIEDVIAVGELLYQFVLEAGEQNV